MPHSGLSGGRTSRHVPLYGRSRPRRHAHGASAPLFRPARRAGARTASFVALGVFAAMVTVGIAIVMLVKFARPG